MNIFKRLRFLEERCENLIRIMWEMQDEIDCLQREVENLKSKTKGDML